MDRCCRFSTGQTSMPTTNQQHLKAPKTPATNSIPYNVNRTSLTGQLVWSQFISSNKNKNTTATRKTVRYTAWWDSHSINERSVSAIVAIAQNKMYKCIWLKSCYVVVTVLVVCAQSYGDTMMWVRKLGGTVQFSVACKKQWRLTKHRNIRNGNHGLYLNIIYKKNASNLFNVV